MTKNIQQSLPLIAPEDKSTRAVNVWEVFRSGRKKTSIHVIRVISTPLFANMVM